MKTIRQFFKDYATASMEGEPKTIATFYADHFIVVGPEGSVCFPNDKKLLTWLKSIVDFNKKTRLEKMMVLKVNLRAVGDLLLHTTVKWGVIYKKTADEIITFKIQYILNINNIQPKILLYSSDQDQEKFMKEKGIL